MTDGHGGQPAGYSPLVYGFSKSMLRIAATIWFRLSFQGRQHAPPSGPLLVVSNHCSYVDPPLVGSGVPRPVRFLAQKGLARFPPLRWWLRKVGVGLIDRNAPSKDVLRALSDALREGGVVCVFPEGTRSADGTVGPFRSGVEFLVRRTGAPVLPAGIDGSFAAFPRKARWPRPRKCTVRYGPVWPAERVLAPGGIDALRREIAGLARARLRDEPDGGTTPPPDGGAPSASQQGQVGHGPGVLPADSSPSAKGQS